MHIAPVHPSQRLHRLAVLAATLLSAATLHAQTPAPAGTLFYENIQAGGAYPTTPIYYAPRAHEVADDAPFPGDHFVSGFSFGYRASVPVRATFRFYGVDPATGLLGARAGEVQRELAAGEAVLTVALSEAEQFAFVAQPHLYPDAEAAAVVPKSGGWFSIAFATLDGSALPADLGLRLAYGPSYAYMRDAETGAVVVSSTGDAAVPTSMYLQLYSSSSQVPTPLPVQLIALASSVKAGQSVDLQTVLSAQVPVGGVTVSYKSSHPRLLSVPATSTASPATSVEGVTATAAARVKKSVLVTLTATANGAAVSTQVTLTP
jgi:hypothetical protein